jgi:hypothetical protein
MIRKRNYPGIRRKLWGGALGAPLRFLVAIIVDLFDH